MERKPKDGISTVMSLSGGLSVDGSLDEDRAGFDLREDSSRLLWRPVKKLKLGR